jgi:methylphosphotriester-DNA--protein-cysteine methyltransferase
VTAAVAAIRAARGSIRIGALAADLGAGLGQLERRFRRVVGASPKQLASIVRLARPSAPSSPAPA